jgi:polyhydroxyalkanoate synthesis regulator phasin
MAQDWKEVFGLGDDDKSINSIDADGVALAAIQGLYEIVKEKDVKIVAQQQRIDSQQEQITVLEARLAALEARMK